jgi:hypothetical protein
MAMVAGDIKSEAHMRFTSERHYSVWYKVFLFSLQVFCFAGTALSVYLAYVLYSIQHAR